MDANANNSGAQTTKTLKSKWQKLLIQGIKKHLTAMTDTRRDDMTQRHDMTQQDRTRSQQHEKRQDDTMMT